MNADRVIEMAVTFRGHGTHPCDQQQYIAMMIRSTKLFLTFLLLLSSLRGIGQATSQAWADSAMAEIVAHPITDYEATLPVSRRLLRYYTERKDTCRMAEANVALGSCYDAVGRSDSALAVLLQASDQMAHHCTPELPFRVALNLSSVYLSLQEFQHADSICSLALGQLTDGRTSKHRGDLMYNRAVALASEGDLPGAEAQFKALEAAALADGDTLNEIDALVNRGALRGMQQDNAGAQRHLEKALALCREVDCPTRATILQNLASVAGDQGHYEETLTYLDSALHYAVKKGVLDLQVTIVASQAETAHNLGDDKRAFAFEKQYGVLRDSLLNVDKVRAISDVREKYQTEKKAKENATLRAANLEAELESTRVKRTRNILSLGLVFAVTFGAVFFFQRNRIAREKARSEELLLNILPEEVAAELKAKGEADAKQIDLVTVLFTDFKGFTAMSEKLTPKELVADIHECFSAFDRIIAKHGIEKIKTIGDAYMAAGGLPTPNTTHAVDVVLAALEIRDFIAEGRTRKEAALLPFFEIRIGIHTGPVVAGIVGVKKFAYDIWGDTVNIASRMESSGEVGKVNVSEATYLLLNAGQGIGYGKEVPGFTFTPRGKVQAKGKGELEMFFVEAG